MASTPAPSVFSRSLSVVSMPTRQTHHRLSALSRRDLLRLSGRLLDALGPRLTHALIADSPVDPPQDAVQLDLYAVDVDGVLSDFAECSQELLRTMNPSSDPSAESNARGAAARRLDRAADALVATLATVVHTEWFDAIACARLVVDNSVAIAAHDRPEGPRTETPGGLKAHAEQALRHVGRALSATATGELFDAFIETVASAFPLFDFRARSELVLAALSSLSHEQRARLCEDWLRERSAWSDAVRMVANVWCSLAEEEAERERVTTAISVYLSEHAEVAQFLGRMFGEAGAIDDARYWLAEGETRFPRDEGIEKELQRWS